jgi:integrase
MRIPKMRQHKATGQARVRLPSANGKHRDVYLGEWGSKEAQDKYDRLIAELLRNHDQPDIVAVTINRLCVSYMEYAQGYYVKDGRPTNEIVALRAALRPWCELYGREPVGIFTPKKLKHVRQRLIDSGLYRKTINDYVKRVIRVLKWGVPENLVPYNVLAVCRELEILKQDRCGNVPESEGVQPVDIDRVEAVKPFVSRQVWGMIRLQLAAGMRPEEVRIIRWCDIDRSDDVWCYVPRIHKMEHKNRNRRIFLGPAGQDILGEFLKADREAFIFSPIDAERERREKQRDNRQTPMTPSQAARTRVAQPKRPPREHYCRNTYNRSIQRACEKAFGMPKALSKEEKSAWRQEHCWTPLQLRHTAATELRKRLGLDAARQVLGHSEATTTEIYAERDFDAARETMRMFG